MTKIEDAVSTFAEGYSCSQAMLSTYGPDFGLDRMLALKLASPFGGGIARMGETCGAVSGALMVIGLKYGSAEPNDKDAKEKTYEVVNKFVERFTEKHGSLRCKDILGYDLSTEEGRTAVSEKGLTGTLCPDFVRSAVGILEDIW